MGPNTGALAPRARPEAWLGVGADFLIQVCFPFYRQRRIQQIICGNVMTNHCCNYVTFTCSSTGPLWVSGGITPGKFLKTQMLNPAFWWLLLSLVGSRGRVYPSKQQACQGLNQFQNFNFSAVVVRTKTNQMEIMKHVNCMQHVILVHNKQRLSTTLDRILAVKFLAF